MFRLQLVDDDGATLDERFIATGEITDDVVLDPLSVTYFGVLATIVLTVGFGAGSSVLSWLGALVLGVTLVLLGRLRPVRHGLTRLSGFGVGRDRSPAQNEPDGLSGLHSAA